MSTITSSTRRSIPIPRRFRRGQRVHFLPLDDQINALTFELNNALNVSRILDGKGQNIQSSRNPSDNTIRVTLPTGLPKGQPAVLTFYYDGRLTGNEDSPIYGIKFAAIQNDYAFLLYPSRWFPVSGYSSDRFTSKINVSVPDGFTVIAGGIESKGSSADHQPTHSFDFTKPSFPGDIAIEKGAPVKISSSGLYDDAVVPWSLNCHGECLWGKPPRKWLSISPGSTASRLTPT